MASATKAKTSIHSGMFGSEAATASAPILLRSVSGTWSPPSLRCGLVPKLTGPIPRTLHLSAQTDVQ
ncbi:hypothetical protein GCM10017711_30350 [Paeniglutamicibacter sulfureus]